jgi:hypothetical protein
MVVSKLKLVERAWYPTSFITFFVIKGNIFEVLLCPFVFVTVRVLCLLKYMLICHITKDHMHLLLIGIDPSFGAIRKYLIVPVLPPNLVPSLVRPPLMPIAIGQLVLTFDRLRQCVFEFLGLKKQRVGYISS